MHKSLQFTYDISIDSFYFIGGRNCIFLNSRDISLYQLISFDLVILDAFLKIFLSVISKFFYVNKV